MHIVSICASAELGLASFLNVGLEGIYVHTHCSVKDPQFNGRIK